MKCELPFQSLFTKHIQAHQRSLVSVASSIFCVFSFFIQPFLSALFLFFSFESVWARSLSRPLSFSFSSVPFALYSVLATCAFMFASHLVSSLSSLPLQVFVSTTYTISVSLYLCPLYFLNGYTWYLSLPQTSVSGNITNICSMFNKYKVLRKTGNTVVYNSSFAFVFVLSYFLLQEQIYTLKVGLCRSSICVPLISIL